jgi:hypothetical protein
MLSLQGTIVRTVRLAVAGRITTRDKRGASRPWPASDPFCRGYVPRPATKGCDKRFRAIQLVLGRRDQTIYRDSRRGRDKRFVRKSCFPLVATKAWSPSGWHHPQRSPPSEVASSTFACLTFSSSGEKHTRTKLTVLSCIRVVWAAQRCACLFLPDKQRRLFHRQLLEITRGPTQIGHSLSLSSRVYSSSFVSFFSWRDLFPCFGLSKMPMIGRHVVYFSLWSPSHSRLKNRTRHFFPRKAKNATFSVVIYWESKEWNGCIF